MLAVVGAMGIGISKAGFVGVGLGHVLIFAFLFGARDSTGIVLPMLLVGDVGGVITWRGHARWDYIRKMLPPACLGILIGVWLMSRLNAVVYRPLLGWIILGLTVLQLARIAGLIDATRIPHSRAFAWALGTLAGVTTMLANAGGPTFALYALAVGLPKYEFVGTNAWFFFLVNAIKVPFSLSFGLIRAGTLGLNLTLLPAILVGLFVGRWLVQHVPQRLFDTFLVLFCGVAAIRMVIG